jgi:hypothetical protein
MKKNCFCLLLVLTLIQSVVSGRSLNTKCNEISFFEFVFVKDTFALELFYKSDFFLFKGKLEPFRMYPALLEFNRTQYENSYENSIFLFPHGIILDTLIIHNVEFSKPEKYIEELMRFSSDSNIIEVSNKKFKKKVVKFFKKYGVKKPYNENIYFALFELTMKCLKYENICFAVPNFNDSQKEGIIKYEIREVFFIIEILNIVPLKTNGKEFIL